MHSILVEKSFVQYKLHFSLSASISLQFSHINGAEVISGSSMKVAKQDPLLTAPEYSVQQ